MTEQLTAPAIDKSAWGPGAWQDEPDRVDFVHAGFACFAKRHPHYGHWCGYVGVPRGHPLYGKDADDADIGGHGGVNYAAACDETSGICHVPEPGMPADVWWFGFDCGHCFDLSPGANATLKRCIEESRAMGAPWAGSLERATDPGFMDTYRALPYVRGKIERLAGQLAAMI